MRLELIKMTRIITVTGPSLSGKSEFIGSLCRILNEESEGNVCEKVMRATTRPPRAGEKDGIEYRFFSEEEMDKAIEKGEAIGWYKHEQGGEFYRYCVLKSSLNHSLDYNLVSIRDHNGVGRLVADSDVDVIPVILFSERLDIDQRTTSIMRELRERGEGSDIEKKLNSIRSRLDDFDKELPDFVNMMHDWRYILFNPNISVGGSSEGILSPEKVIYHLASRFVKALKLEEIQEYCNLSDNDFRHKYVTGLIKKLIKKDYDDVGLDGLGSAKKIDLDKEVIKTYSNRTGIDETELVKMVPSIIGSTYGYGIISLYINPASDEKTKKHVLNLLEMQLGLPQHRFDGLSQDVKSPMNLVGVDSGYTNFYLSFSAAYDPESLPKRDDPIHTLVIEALNRNDDTKIRVLEPDDAGKEWKKQGDLIRRTNLPYSLG